MKLLSLTLILTAVGCSVRPVSHRVESGAVVTVRQAIPADVARMVELSALKRAQYEAYSPVFWRPAAGASEAQTKFFASLVGDPSWICLVHDSHDGIDGFIMARVTGAPPVYDPGGKVCMIDDFVVAEPSLWTNVGMALRDEAERRAAEAGAVISVTVCGERDIAKKTALRNLGAHIASEWHVRSIDQGHSR